MLVQTKWSKFLQSCDNSHDSTSVAPLLNVLTLVVIGITLLALVGLAVASTPNQLSYVVTIAILIFALITRGILALGYAQVATVLLLSVVYVSLTLFAIIAGGLASASFGILMLISLFTGLMLGPVSAIRYMVIFILTVAGFYLAEANGWLPLPIEQGPVDYIIAHVGGALVGTVFVLYVIRHINQGVAEIQRNEEQLREIFEFAPIGMATTTLEGQFLRANQALCNTLGYTLAELRRQKCPEITHPDDLSLNLSLTNQLIGGEISHYELEKRYLCKDGSTVTAFVQVSLIRDSRGNPHQLIAQILDLTERRRAEEALRQAQKLESLGVLAGGIAHDFNNLLTAMLAQSSLVREKLAADSPALPNVVKIVSAAERAANLTQQMLAYAGQGSFQIQPLDLNNVICENLHLLDVAIPKNVCLERKLATALPLVNADIGQIQQMIMNLIINAAEAVALKQANESQWNKSPTKGLVTVTTDMITIGDDEQRFRSYTNEALSAGTYASVCVVDNGSGMDDETLPKIFDPFFSTKMSGRGLGLAAVLGIVCGHDGGLHVESEVGEGTSFCVLLPATAIQPETVLSGPPIQSVGDLIGRSILVIDDEADVRDAVVDILSCHGAHMLAATDGASGIELYRQSQETIHLIILDLSMPGLSGEETFHQLRLLNPKVPILISSGFSESASSIRLKQDCISSFLQKPYQWEELIFAVEKHLK